MKSVLTLVLVVILGGILFMAAGELPYGNPPRTELDGYFIANGQRETGANNIVTSVLFDYRGLDTLGEASVLFTAVLGVVAVLRRLLEGEDYAND